MPEVAAGLFVTYALKYAAVIEKMKVMLCK